MIVLDSAHHSHDILLSFFILLRLHLSYLLKTLIFEAFGLWSRFGLWSLGGLWSLLGFRGFGGLWCLGGVCPPVWGWRAIGIDGFIPNRKSWFFITRDGLWNRGFEKKNKYLTAV